MFTYKVLPEFIGSELCEELLQWFDKTLSVNGAGDRINENIHELNISHVQNEDIVKNIFDDVKSIIFKNDCYGVSFDKLWLVRSLSGHCNQNVLPYVPHFDKKRYLKALIYLTDVGLDDGPIHICSKFDISIDGKRRRLPKNYKTNGLNVVKNISSLHLNPIVGKAGTLILFDTNTPHHAGVVSAGHARKILRFDFEDPSWNKLSWMERLNIFEWLHNR